MSKAKKDHIFDTLLELDGIEMFVDEKQSYLTRFRAKQIEPTKEKPHGINYSLTLHDPAGKRVLGYDNAHATKATDGPGGKKTQSQDHIHRYDTIRPYKFKDVATLLTDFWENVDKILTEKGAKKWRR